ncbi:hypothetical protein [Polynucleobacter sp. UK-Kesae-W10]|uniref:hypothetical protein n=1 Tax=Polynucleobacter sp. UK-Kesae-W10 TaxID=1819738 RepID=UPI001C0CB297|nr:hypothetical protein [Polynucleobacter sp. UK-Kesae-W10]MBU3577571.1 hypothetical protein [Polynucleobacter sp. UK-Kesae-W10]
MTDKNEYEAAWNEGGEEAKPAENALAAAKKVSDTAEADDYVTAYDEIDSGQSVNGEDLKNVKPKDKTQEAGNIATNTDSNDGKGEKKDDKAAK